MDDLFTKLDTLRKAYPSSEDQEKLSILEQSTKIAIITANLQNNPGIAGIIGQYQKELTQINKELTDNEALFSDSKGPELGRLLHARKKWCKKFLAIFDRAEQQVEIKKGIINKEIEDINN